MRLRIFRLPECEIVVDVDEQILFASLLAIGPLTSVLATHVLFFGSGDQFVSVSCDPIEAACEVARIGGACRHIVGEKLGEVATKLGLRGGGATRTFALQAAN